MERYSTDARHAFRNHDARKTNTIIERSISDAGHASIAWNDAIPASCNQGLTFRLDQAISLRMINSIPLFYSNTFEIITITKYRTADTLHTDGDRDARQRGAVIKRRNPYSRHTVGNRDVREATATIERIIADASHAIRNRDAREATATVERMIADTRHTAVSRNYTILTSGNQGFTCSFNQTIPGRMIHCISVFDSNAREATATSEHRIADARHTIRNRDAREATATIERIIADACHAFRYRDAREATAIRERPVADARHAVCDDYCFDAISVTVPRSRGGRRSIVHHLLRSANGQRSAFVIKCPREVISLCAAGAVIGFGRRGQDEKRRERGDKDD